MTSPVNPKLYNALVDVFTAVEISNEGAEVYEIARERSLTTGKPRWSARCWGEYYRVNCPFCRDQRQRLWINHRWAECDDETGDDMLFLAHCYNEDCLATRQDQEKLYWMVYPGNRRLRLRRRNILAAQKAPTSQAVHPISEIALPAGVVMIDQPGAQEAVSYLQSRGFSAQDILRSYKVFHCYDGSGCDPDPSNRLLIPLHRVYRSITGRIATENAGWMARSYFPGPSAYKYLFARGTRKSQLLYGLAQAIHTKGPVVIAEGPTDVWRLGCNGVALLGKSMSAEQQALIRRYFGGRPLVVLLDRDAGAEAKRTVQLLLAERRRERDSPPVVQAVLPIGFNDIGECYRATAWDRVAAALGERRSALGVEVRL